MKSINFYNFNFVVLPNFEYKQNKELWKVTDVVSHNQSPAKVCSVVSKVKIKQNSEGKIFGKTCILLWQKFHIF